MRLASILLVAVSIVVVASSGEARAQSINGLTASDFDLTSDPKGVSSDADEQYYWDMQKHSTTCVDYKPQYGSSTTLHLESLPPSFFANATPESIFPRAEPLPACVASGAQSDRLQDPISTNVAPPPLATNSAAAVANYRDVYGNHPTEIFADHAAYWFSFELAQYRAFSDPADAQALIATMLKWAKGGALTDNVQIGGNKGTVIYTMSTTMAPILNAYAELAPMMTPDQRRIVGPCWPTAWRTAGGTVRVWAGDRLRWARWCLRHRHIGGKSLALDLPRRARPRGGHSVPVLEPRARWNVSWLAPRAETKVRGVSTAHLSNPTLPLSCTAPCGSTPRCPWQSASAPQPIRRLRDLHSGDRPWLSFCVS